MAAPGRYVAEADVLDPRKMWDEDELYWSGGGMTWDEWWDEWRSNACCPDPGTAAHRLCGCGGSGSLPTDISRLLAGEEVI